jgi:energy-coupling factor transport system permease protein
VQETQRLRGFDPRELGPLARARTYAKIAVPVILGSMFKAQQLELVLQAKAFSGASTRTWLHEARLRARDWAVIALSACVLAAAVLLRSGTAHLNFLGGW